MFIMFDNGRSKVSNYYNNRTNIEYVAEASLDSVRRGGADNATCTLTGASLTLN